MRKGKKLDNYLFFKADHAATLQVESSDEPVSPQPSLPPFPHLPPLPPLPHPDESNSQQDESSSVTEQSRKRRQSDGETASDGDNPGSSSGVASLDDITAISGQGHNNPGGQIGHHPPPLPLPPPHFHPSPDSELNNVDNSHLNPVVGVSELSNQGLEPTTPSSSFS